MAEWKINSEEDTRLQGLSLLAQVIYMRVFRRLMDYGTGIAGGKVKRNIIKMGKILNTVEFMPDQGSKKKTWAPKSLTEALLRMPGMGLSLNTKQ